MKSTALASLLALTALGLSAAQAAELRFTNAPTVPAVELAEGSTLNVTGVGDVEVQCAESDCGLTLQSGGDAPAVNFTAPANGVEVASGASVSLAWSQQRAAVCLGTSTPVVSGWNNRMLLPSETAASVNMPSSAQAITYTLNLQCFNSDGGNLPVASRTINVAATTGGGGGGGNPVGCDGISDPLFQPSGWNQTVRTWAQAYPGCTFPTCNQNTILSNLGPNKYTSIRVDNAVAGTFYEFYVGELQSGAAPGAVMITVSNCPGDFRRGTMTGDSNTDPSLSPGCRPTGGNGTIPYRAMNNPVYSSSQCRVDASRPIYYNLIAANLDDGLSEGENTCSGGVTNCGVYIYHIGY